MVNKHLHHALSRAIPHKFHHGRGIDLDKNVSIGCGLKSDMSKWKVMDDVDYKPRTMVYAPSQSASSITNGAGGMDTDLLNKLHFGKKPKKVKL